MCSLQILPVCVPPFSFSEGGRNTFKLGTLIRNLHKQSAQRFIFVFILSETLKAKFSCYLGIRLVSQDALRVIAALLIKIRGGRATEN